MSDLTVEMILSLVDSASPKLKLFRDALDSVSKAAKETTDTLENTQEVMDDAAPSVERVAEATKVLASSSRTTARAMLGINDRLLAFVGIAKRSIITLNELNASMGRVAATSRELSASLGIARDSARGTATQFNRTFHALNKLGASADDNSLALGRLKTVLNGIAPEADALAGASVTAAAALDGIGASAKRSAVEVGSLHSGMKGLLAIYAGWKLDEGLKAGVKQNIQMQEATGKIKLLNLSPQTTRNQVQQANQLPEQYPYLTPAEAMKIQGDAYAAVTTTNRGLIAPTIGAAIKIAHAMKTFGDTNTYGDIVRNLYGASEPTGHTANAADIISSMRQTLKVWEGTHGKLTARDIETIYRNTKAGEALSMTNPARYLQMSYAEQLKTSGHGGGGGAGVAMAGTSATMVGKIAQSIRMNRMAVNLLVGAGLMHASKIVKNSGSTTYANLAPGALVRGKLAVANPLQWAHQAGPNVLAFTQKHWKDYYKTATEGMGKSVEDLAAQSAALTRYWNQVGSVLGGINFTNMMVMTENPKEWTRLQGGAKTMAASAGIGQADKISAHLLSAKLLSLKASMETLANTIGTNLSPKISALVDGLTNTFQAINTFALKFPRLTGYLTDAAGALSLLLIGWGALELLGKAKDLMKFIKMIGSIGTAAKVAEPLVAGGTDAIKAAGIAGGEAAAGVGLFGGKLAGLAGVLRGAAIALGRFMAPLMAFKMLANTSPAANIPGQMYTPSHPVLWPGGKPPIEYQLNNPGGLRSWGSTPLAQAGNNGFFAKFPTALAGLQAMAENLIAYGKSGRNTLASIIPTWNGHGSNTPGYIKGVSAVTGFGAGQKLNMTDPKTLHALMFAMIQQEIGQVPYSQSLLTQAATQATRSHRAGMTAEQKSVANIQAGATKVIGSLPATIPTSANIKNVSAPYVAAISNVAQAVVQQDKVLNAQYKQGVIKLANYYAAKRALLTSGIGQEIAILQKEATAFAGQPNMVNATLAKIAGRRQALVNGLKLIDSQQMAQEAKMQVSLAKRESALQKQYDSLTGTTASPQQLVAQYAKISGGFAASGHMRYAKMALTVGNLLATKSQYGTGMAQYAAMKQNLHNTITGNAALVQTGAMTKMDAAQANINAQKKAAPAMLALLQNMIALEKASAGYATNMGSHKIVAALQAQVTAVKAMGGQLGYYTAKVKNITQNAMTGLFQNMMHGQKTWGQMFASFFASIGKGLENTLAKSISAAIANALFSKKAGKGGASLLGGLTQLVGSIFGGGTGASTASKGLSGAGILGAGAFSKGPSTMSMVSGGVSLIKDITSIAGLFGFASGANNIPNDMVANIHKGEMIIPAGPAAAIRAGQGSVGGNQLHLTVHAMDSQSVISALHSVRYEAAQMFINTQSSMNLGGG